MYIICKIENCKNFCGESSRHICDICYEEILNGNISFREYEIAKNKKRFFSGYSKKEKKKIKKRTAEKAKKGIAQSVAEGTLLITLAILMIGFLSHTIALWLPLLILFSFIYYIYKFLRGN